VILLAVHPLATLNAVLNSLAALLLVVGWLSIRSGNTKRHRAAMVAAFGVSTVFLVS
jgi:putative membrane protein